MQRMDGGSKRMKTHRTDNFSEKTNFSHLYSDALQNILSFLLFRDLCKLRRLSKRTNPEFDTAAALTKYLDISSAKRDEMKSAAECCRNLTFAEVNWFRNGTAELEDIKRIFRNNPKISRLGMKVPRGLCQMFVRFINSLNLPLVDVSMNFGDYMPLLQTSGRDIRKLRWDAGLLNLVEWLQIAEFCPELEYLDCENPQSEFTRLIGQHLPFLKTLVIYYIQITDAPTPISHPGLTSLTVYYPKFELQISPSAFLGQLPNLTKLDLLFYEGGSASVGFNIVGLSKLCPKLKSLDLSLRDGGCNIKILGLIEELPCFRVSLERFCLFNFGTSRSLQEAFREFCERNVVFCELKFVRGWRLGDMDNLCNLDVVAPKLWK